MPAPKAVASAAKPIKRELYPSDKSEKRKTNGSTESGNWTKVKVKEEVQEVLEDEIEPQVPMEEGGIKQEAGEYLSKVEA